jgi:ADP-ribosylglycohydrolase
MTDISIADRITGSLLGLAVGDALGAPLESLKDGHILQLFGGEVNDYADSFAAFPDRPGKWRLKGLYTDDTQQALAVAEILAVHGRMDLRALADLYIRLADEGPAEAPFGAHRGVGHIFRRAVGALRETENPLAAGQPSAGNGAAMRVAPVGLFYADDQEALARAAIEVSLMTHHDPRGVAAALAVARAVAWFVQGNADPLQLAKELPSGSTPGSSAWTANMLNTLFRKRTRACTSSPRRSRSFLPFCVRKITIWP